MTMVASEGAGPHDGGASGKCCRVVNMASHRCCSRLKRTHGETDDPDVDRDGLADRGPGVF